MKVTAGILLFYFSVLTAQPMASFIHARMHKEKQTCTMACCQHHPKKKQESKSSPFGCCNSDMTNPFAQYSCCIGFIAAEQQAELVLTSHTYTQYINSETWVPNYYSDCWRPPKLSVC